MAPGLGGKILYLIFSFCNQPEGAGTTMAQLTMDAVKAPILPLVDESRSF
jgi:hypothetical protein